MLHNFQRCLEENSGYESEHMKVLYYDLEEGYQGTYRSYENNRICTILKGSKNVTINNGEGFIYQQDEFILLPPHSSVEMKIEEHTTAVVYEISDKVVDFMSNRIQNQFHQDLDLEEFDGIQSHSLTTIQSSVGRMHQIMTSQDSDKGILMDLVAQEMVYHLYKNNFLQNNSIKPDKHPIEFAIKYMQEHISENISLSELSHYLNMSPSHFSSTFKKSTGFSPKSYLNMIKVKKSKQLLMTKSVTEVAYELGFESISYYIDLFKRHYGETPKQYVMRLK